jgi:hypothetical protein
LFVYFTSRGFILDHSFCRKCYVPVCRKHTISFAIAIAILRKALYYCYWQLENGQFNRFGVPSNGFFVVDAYFYWISFQNVMDLALILLLWAAPTNHT